MPCVNSKQAVVDERGGLGIAAFDSRLCLNTFGWHGRTLLQRSPIAINPLLFSPSFEKYFSSFVSSSPYQFSFSPSSSLTPSSSRTALRQNEVGRGIGSGGVTSASSSNQKMAAGNEKNDDEKSSSGELSSLGLSDSKIASSSLVSQSKKSAVERKKLKSSKLSALVKLLKLYLKGEEGWRFAIAFSTLFVSSATNLLFPSIMGRALDIAVGGRYSTHIGESGSGSNSGGGDITTDNHSQSSLSSFISTLSSLVSRTRFEPNSGSSLMDSGSTIGIERSNLTTATSSSPIPGHLPPLWTLAFAAISIFTVGCISSWVRVYNFGVASYGLEKNMRIAVLEKLMRKKKMIFFEKQKFTDLCLRFVNDVELCANTLSQNAANGMRSINSTIGATMMMLLLSRKLTMVTMMVVPMIGMGAMMLSKVTKRLRNEKNAKMTEALGDAQELLSSIGSVRILSRERIECDRFVKQLDHLKRISQRTSAADGLFMGGMSLAVNVSLISILAFGGFLVNKNELSIGKLTSFSIYAFLVGLGSSGLLNIYSDLNKANDAAERVLEILNDDEDEIDENCDGETEISGADSRNDRYADSLTESELKITKTKKVLKCRDVKGNISFENVCFRYPQRLGQKSGVSEKNDEKSKGGDKMNDAQKIAQKLENTKNPKTDDANGGADDATNRADSDICRKGVGAALSQTTSSQNEAIQNENSCKDSESDSDERYILTNFSLSIKKNEVLGVTGQSGCGKSTSFINLLTKIYGKTTKGRIKIDDYDIDDIDGESLRSEIISVVPQEPILFHGSIYDNIAIGDSTYPLPLESAPSSNKKRKDGHQKGMEESVEMQKSMKNLDEKVKWAAEKANVTEFTDKLDDGMDTIVRNSKLSSSSTSTLSMGQKQRIAIARAIFKKPKILIFDEATNGLDGDNERLILDNILNKKEQNQKRHGDEDDSKDDDAWNDKTIILISHKSDVLKRADRVAVIENGKVCEIGAFSELSSKEGSRLNKLLALQD